ncbi:MAG: hypothetical protein A2Y10_18445 [Planctomycetes bacterium GWF2_41_51]|nr:MAG: hypothetical protein A2Y10_18445 [Planctomycetes bacterium GWF2_41_51]HBG26673.1 hypothetical protein [Phycisphaerales bacterium]
MDARKSVYVFLLVFTLSNSIVFAADAGDFTQNGVFLSHNYVKYQSYVNLVPTLGYNMNVNYRCKYLFVNAGMLNSNGVITNAATELAKVKDFLNAVKTYENSSGFQFIVIGWISGDKNNLAISNSAIRSAIVSECKKFVSATVPGSYVSGANRVFDGISMDIEPSGNDDTYYNHYKTLMDDIRASFNASGLSSKLTSVCAHKYGTGSIYHWSPVYYYYMARRVNFIAAMTYNSNSSSAAAYQTWIGDQTYYILRAVSGKYWDDEAHPVPTNGVKILIGFPAYPASASHNPAYENARYAALGTLEGLDDLEADASDPSENYFKAGFLYLHTDGTGGDNYANYSTDWWWWGRYWLAAW